MISGERVSEVLNKKIATFTVDALVEMLRLIGQPVRLAIN